MVKYRGRTDRTIGYRESYLKDFHRHKEVLARFHAKKFTKRSALAMRQELPDEQGADRESSNDWNSLSNLARACRIEEGDVFLL